jgi:flagellar basal-body rod protein FlgB
MEVSSSMALTVESVRLALGASTLRHSLIADNIANANTPGHVRMKVVFEEHLSQALDQAAASGDVGALADASAEVRPAASRGTKVSLDQEMVDLSSNAVRYQALTRGLSRYFSIASAIASGSRS